MSRKYFSLGAACMILSMAAGGGPARAQENPAPDPGPGDPEAHGLQSVGFLPEELAEMRNPSYISSLKERERTDFLILPAMLAQDALLADVPPIQPPSPDHTRLHGVRFDATLVHGAPGEKGTLALFVRYWVTRDGFRAEVVWAEPAWMGIHYAYYPLTLALVSNEDRFAMMNARTEKRWVYEQPIGERGPSPYILGRYDIEDIRFAVGEHKRARVHIQNAAAPAPGRETGELPAKQTVRGEDGQLLKSVRYESAAAEGGAPRLKRKVVTIPEREVLVGRGEKRSALRVRANGEVKEVRTWKVIFPKGGRRREIVYQTLEVGGEPAVLPVGVEVFAGGDEPAAWPSTPVRVAVLPGGGGAGGDGKRLRRAVMSNYQPIPEGQTQAVDQLEPTLYPAYTENEQELYRLFAKYWGESVDTITAEDRRAIERLRKHFAQEPDAPIALGERFKRLSMRSSIARLLKNDEDLLRLFGQHLELMDEAGLSYLMFQNGREMIRQMIRSERYALADRLMAAWVERSMAANDVPAALRFARAEVAWAQGWPTYNLLKAVAEKTDDSPSRRYQAEYLMCKALWTTVRLGMRRGEDAVPRMENETRWVRATMGESDFKGLLEEHLQHAARMYERLPNPGRTQERMREDLEQIREQFGD